MAGLSPDQQRWLLQAAESMRGQQTPPPRQRALTDGEAERRREVQPGGSLLGPLALPAGHQPEALVLRPLDLPVPLDGEAAVPVTPAPVGPPVQYGPPNAPLHSGVSRVNAFWSDRVQNEANGIVVPAPEVPRQSADGLVGVQTAEQPAPAPENRVMAGDGTLSHQDLIELEALRANAVRDVEARVRQEAQRRRDQQAASRAGSFHSAVGGNGGNVPQGGGGSALPSQSGLSPLLPPGLGQGQHGLPSQQVGHAGLPQPGGHLPQGGYALPGGQVPRVSQPQPQQPQAQPPHFGESLNESLRSLELPKISQNCSALEFGDWLAVVGPLMADLSGSSSQWWALVLAAANEAYARWQVSTPLERLRLRVVFPLDIYRWPRTEQRAVTMLLAAVPDELRREMIANRKLNSMDILFTLLCRFQPGGASERASLLRDISDPQLKQNSNVQDFLTALRLWRRNLGRAVELGLQLPDPLILVNLLTRWADHLGRLGGAQLSYRVASLRQQLQLDTMPNSTSVVEFAEALQAEAEQLALSVQSTTSTSMTTLPSSSTASAEKIKKEPVKAAALQAEADSPKKGDTTTKAKCRFWGTPAGCKRADECKFEHSWDGMEKRGKCWACSSDQHMRNECPYKKKDGGSSPQKMAKVTGPKPKPTKSGKETKEGGDATSSTSSTPGTLPTSSSTATSKDEKTKTPIIEELPATSSTSTSLVNDITGLVKSLQSLKAVQLRYADACGGDKGGREEKVALIDGGATHPLRQGSELEIQEAEPVQVELAHGSTTLYRKRGCSTLLSREKIETIVPVRLLIDLGYKITWNSGGCTIRHPTKGALRCWRRQGCPIMDEEEALSLLSEVEKEKQKGIADEIRHYWSLRFPNVPDDIFRFMKGQNRDAKLLGDELPWNRRQRRQFETAKNGILLHLFSGDADKRKKREEVGQTLGLQVMTLDILNNQNLHDEGVWCYVFHLAKLGKIKILVGGPPCRTTSRLRHQRPGPVPLRGRGHLRWRLPDLSAPNRDLVDGDTALILKMLGIYDAAVEYSEGDVGFLMEHPDDPKMYLDANQHPVDEYPSVWEWPEIQAFAQLHKMSFVAFDQGATGHKRKKPTRLLTNLNGMEELNDLRSEGESAALPSELGARLQESSSWASWSPGLVAAIQVAIKSFMNEGMVPSQKRMTLRDWRQHCQQGHVPYRRDCRLCVQEMGADVPHRRLKHGGHAVYNLSVDIAGPFHNGWDYGTKTEARYALIATAPVPLSDLKPEASEDPLQPGPQAGSAEGQPLDDARIDQALESEDALRDLLCGDGPHAPQDQPLPEVPLLPEDPLQPVGELPEGAAPVLETGEDEKQELSEGEKKVVGKMNEKWKREKEEKEEAEKPLKIQNVTMMAPLTSRHVKHVLPALQTLHARFRSLGIPMLRMHSDRAKEFISRPVRAWTAQVGMYQTVTSGDDSKSNGRCEAELGQWKRRLRLLLKSSGSPISEWPSVARHAMEERTRAQLKHLGLEMPPMIPYNTRVMVKTKVWSKRFTKGMSSPFFAGLLKGPSPLMSHGWVVQSVKDRKIQHARAVLVTDPLADQAMLEFELETRPEVRHRLTGKQQVFPRLPPPQLIHSGSSFDGAEAPQEAAEPLALMDGFVAPPDDDIEDYDPESPVAFEPNDDGHGDDDRENEPDYVFVDDGDALHRGESPAVRAFGPTVGGDPEHGSGGEDASLFRPQPLQAGQDLCAEQVQQGPQRGEADPGGEKTLLRGTSPVASSTSSSPSTFQSCSMAEDGVFTWPWGGSVENYEDWLQSAHYGWNKLMREEMKETPMNGDEGLRKGQLLQNAQNEVMALQQELEVTNKILNKKFQMKHLAAAEETGDVVLQTYTVPLQDVRANLPEWIEALKGEYTSLTKTTGAVTPIRLEDLGDEEVEYAPAKLVATRKAPDGKRRTRIVACGNLVTSSVQTSGAAEASETNCGNQKKSADTYAAGVEGSVMRATLRTCAARGFTGATTDVKTAFLLAPRRGKGKLVVRPPKILVESGLISSDELWMVNQALYGLQASPADWSQFRDDTVKTWRWEHKGMAMKLLPTMEPNLWRVLGDNKTTLGFMLVYVDDLMVLGPLDVVESVIDQIRKVWTCSTPEFFNTETTTKFCGFELKHKKHDGDGFGPILVGQESYARELCNRHGNPKPRPTPMSSTLSDKMPLEKDDEIDLQTLRKAQGITGEILWLSVRSRPDLAYVAGVMGRLASKNPSYVIDLGKEVIGYVAGTTSMCLEYGRCDPNQFKDILPFARSMTRLEVFADISFAPGGGRSIQGIVAMLGGCPVQWESSRQTCISLSTAEAELLSYVEAMSVADSLASLVESLEEVPSFVPTSDQLDDDELLHQEITFEDKPFVEANGELVQRALFGDNTAAIAVLTLPDGPWRTRHLRLRSAGLRERLTRKKAWALRHLSGLLLVADHLTKAINPRQRWMHFYKFMNIVFDDKVQSELIIQDPGNVPEKIETLDVNIEVKKILAASLSAVALSTVKPAENTPEYEEKNKLMNEIKEFVQLKALRLQTFCTSSKKGVREAEGPSLKTLGMPSAPLPAYFNEDGDENRYVRDDVENVRDDSREDDGVRSTTLDGIDLGDLPPQGRAVALHPEEVQPGELPLQDRALASDAVLGELALQDRALASSASAAVLGDLPQQARALAAAAVLCELAEQDLALASSHAAGLGALHPERTLHGADAASSGALWGQLGALPVFYPGEEEPRLLPLQAEVPVWNQNVPEISGGDTAKSAELAQIEKGTLEEGIGEPEEELLGPLPERDLHGPVWLFCTGPLGSTNVAGKPVGWKKNDTLEIDSAEGTISSVQLGVQIQGEKYGDWKSFSPSVIQQPKGHHNFSSSSVFPSVADDENVNEKCGDGWKTDRSERNSSKGLNIFHSEPW